MARPASSLRGFSIFLFDFWFVFLGISRYFPSSWSLTSIPLSFIFFFSFMAGHISAWCFLGFAERVAPCHFFSVLFCVFWGFPRIQYVFSYLVFTKMRERQKSIRFRRTAFASLLFLDQFLVFGRCQIFGMYGRCVFIGGFGSFSPDSFWIRPFISVRFSSWRNLRGFLVLLVVRIIVSSPTPSLPFATRCLRAPALLSLVCRSRGDLLLPFLPLL